jgi:uncharacterized membrane protein YdjX (TVP38/TMEM64 family)
VPLVAAVLVAVWLLPVRDWLLRLPEIMRAAGWRGVALFFVVYAVSAVALLPGSLLTLAAGFAYGPFIGLLVVSPASVVGATLAFLMGRTLLRGWVERKLADAPKVRALDRALERQSFRLILLLRLSPLLPFNLLNYALSLSKVRLRDYVLASFIGMLPVTFLYVYLGSLATTAAALTQAAETRSPWKTVMYMVGLAATIVAVYAATRAAQKALNEELEIS